MTAADIVNKATQLAYATEQGKFTGIKNKYTNKYKEFQRVTDLCASPQPPLDCPDKLKVAKDELTAAEGAREGSRAAQPH